MREARMEANSRAQLTIPNRPRVSVCMAAYNGERYIAAQLQSILGQLADGDEVIVVDDASTDGTRGRVRAFHDNRIRLIVHPANLGVSRTFEDAIRAASHSIIFLSDQDDLWVSTKVDEVLELFSRTPEVTLVTSDNSLINVDGSLIKDSYFTPRGRFRPGLLANLIRNRYGGCNMAFRASILSEVLPLPHRYDVLHDVWIGVRNSLSYGEARYIDKVLVLNRRHDNTLTGRNLSIWRKARVRIHLLCALLCFSVRRRCDFRNHHTSRHRTQSI